MRMTRDEFDRALQSVLNRGPTVDLETAIATACRDTGAVAEELRSELQNQAEARRHRDALRILAGNLIALGLVAATRVGVPALLNSPSDWGVWLGYLWIVVSVVGSLVWVATCIRYLKGRK